MNYQQHYSALISTRKTLYNTRHQERKLGSYFECHHILPRALGGSNQKDNLVYLTAREHFLAHWLLWKIHRNKQMAWAFAAFTCKTNKSLQRKKLTSRQFEAVRLACSKANSGVNNKRPMLGRKRSVEHSKKLREIHTGRKVSEATRQKMRVNSTGRRHSEQTKQKLRNIKANVSQQTRRKLSVQKRGHLNPNFGRQPWNNNAVTTNPKLLRLWTSRNFLYDEWLQHEKPEATAFSRLTAFRDRAGGSYQPSQLYNLVRWFKKRTNDYAI